MDNDSSQRKNSARRNSLKLHLPKQKSAENDHNSLTRRNSTHDQNDIMLRRVQSFNSPGKCNRRLKVLHRPKSKLMIKITLSPDPSPEKTPPEIFSSFDIDVEGANKKSCTPRNFSQEKSFKVFFENDVSKGKHIDADIIVKEKEKEVERFHVNELFIQKEKHLHCNNMNLVASPPEWNLPDLRLFGNKDIPLCDRETSFLQKRKMYIRTAIKNLLNEEITDINDVPHIALMGSGGGYRAMVAMSGIMNAMYDELLLDCVMYTAALSGSSWYIANLYSHPEWPNVDPRKVQEKMKHDISTNPTNIYNVLHYGFDFFTKKWSRQDWNFTTDVFGPMLGDALIPDRRESRWSDQAVKLSEGTVPLPLLAAIHAKEEENTDTFHEWVEFSPFEVSMSKYGAAIDMKHFGSEFTKGERLTKHKEPPLYEIMGICGSAFTITHEELLNKDAGQSKEDQHKNKSRLTHKSQSSSIPDNKTAKRTHQLSTQEGNKEGYDELDGIIIKNQQTERKHWNQHVGNVLCSPVDENEELFDQLDGMSSMSFQTKIDKTRKEFDQIDGMIVAASKSKVKQEEKPFEQLDGMSVMASQTKVNKTEEQFDQLDGMSIVASQTKVNKTEEQFDQLDGMSSMTSQAKVNKTEEQFDEFDGMAIITSQTKINKTQEQFDQLDGMSIMASQMKINKTEEQFDQLDGMSIMASQTKINKTEEQFDQLDGMSNMTSQTKVNKTEEQFEQLDGMSIMASQTKINKTEEQFEQLDGMSNMTSQTKVSKNKEQFDETGVMSSMIKQHTATESEEQYDQLDTMQKIVTSANDPVCNSVLEPTDVETCEKYDRKENDMRLNRVLQKKINDEHVNNENGVHIRVPENAIIQTRPGVFDDVFQRKDNDMPSKDIMKDLENCFATICEITGKGKDDSDVSDEIDGSEGRDELDGLGYFIPESVKNATRKMFMKNRSTRAAMINNFMRKVSFDEPDGPPVQCSLFENYMKKDLEKLCLIDAGIAFNSPYPLLFQPGRDIDLILSFDFTDRHKDVNDPFKTLLKTESWAKTHEIKFPKIAENVEKFNEKEVEEMYIFEDETDVECPIIMHFVLVNNDFREYTKPGVKRETTEEMDFADFNIYDDQSTFHCMNFQYTEENFDRLSKLSEFIVLNNLDQIKTCIRKSIRNKRKRTTRNRQRHPTAPL